MIDTSNASIGHKHGTMIDAVVGLNDIDTPDARDLGGKASTLARLASYGFQVPTGIVVRARLGRWLLRQPAVKAAIGALPPGPERAAGGEGLRRGLAAVRDAIRAEPLPVEVISALESELLRHGLDRIDCAVRSSSVAEDGATHAFAGIHDTFLNVCGPNNIASKVSAVIASAWSDRATAYRSRFGLGDDAADMAVLVMPMVKTEAGGVLFTAAPRSGSRARCLLTVAERPCEVVDGSAVVESWTLDASAPTAIRIIECHRRKGLPDLLHPAHARELVTVGLAVERALFYDDCPIDLEWGRSGGHFVLLQARPVTAIDYGWQAPGRTVPALWSNANLKDGSPNVQSPLGADIMRLLLHAILSAPFLAAGRRAIRTAPLGRVERGRLFMNVAALQWAYHDAFRVPPRELSKGIGGFHDDLIVEEARPVTPAVRFATFRLVLAMVGTLAASKAVGSWRAARARRRSRATLERFDNARLCRAIQRETERMRRAGARFQLMNSLAGAVYRFLTDALADAGHVDADALARRLVAGAGDVDSIDYVRTLELMAALVRARAVDGGEAGGMIARLVESGEDPVFSGLLRNLLDRHGHRCVYEQEIAHPRWAEDPTFLLRNLELMAAADPPLRSDPAEICQRARELALSSVPLYRRPLLVLAIALSRRSAGLRENSKSATVRLAQPLRACLLECGSRMVAAGAIETRDDVFLCVLSDIFEWLAGGGRRSFVKLTRDRAVRMERLNHDIPPDVLDRPRVSEPLEAAPRSSFSMKGSGAAPGRASGKARFISHPSQFNELRNGEIIVAPSSDPAWTSLFYRSSAIVLEMGGVLSHGAILARELGLPAVVNTGPLAHWLRDGELIHVDGDSGLITKQ